MLAQDPQDAHAPLQAAASIHAASPVIQQQQHEQQPQRAAFQDITAETTNSQHMAGDLTDTDAVSLSSSKASSMKAATGAAAGPARLSARGHDEAAVRGGPPHQLPQQDASVAEQDTVASQSALALEAALRRSRAWVGDFGHLDTAK